MTYYKSYIKSTFDALHNLVVTNDKEVELNVEDGFEQWCLITKELNDNGGTIFFIGNGASAAMASHMSADANKNGGL